ncbi:MAG: bifunctional (p)ppGpp synthetase/guanosine-3',5'-bis(diphosphate) 3'-pyrophosphohydrolase [Bacteroidales bacterium]
MFSGKMEKILQSSPENERRWVYDSLEIAASVLKSETRSDGSPFIDHVTSVASIIVTEIGLMPGSVAAFFLHEASRVDISVITKHKKAFSDEIIAMCESLNKISGIKPKDTGLQAENYRKLIVSYSRDPRVTLIKLADRLEVMRKLDIFSKSKQLKKATETQLLYAPLAHQLGLYNIKTELEDLAFRYTDPENYRIITNKLKAGEQERKRLIDLFVKPIETELKKARIKYTLKSRTKSAYSIHKKMVTQQIPFEGVADLFAIRIIIDSPDEREKELCWNVYSIVTKSYTPDTDRLRDWITVPKESGYESLHTTVKTKDNHVIEIQIRTVRMDDIAENGYAAHWSYKGVKSEAGLTNWLAGVKKLLESGNMSEGLSELELSLNEIFVFTPEGDLRRLSAGSSVLDFAFDIHSNLGIRCSGAKVNGKPASIRERLKTGDVVEIMSNKNQRPSIDWLNYVVSSKARAKIKQKLKEEAGKRALEGKELLERRINNWKLDFNDEVITFLLKHFKYKTAAEFYVDVVNEVVDIAQVKTVLATRESEKGVPESREQFIPPPPRIDKAATESTTDYLVIDDKVNNVGFKLSKCCNPIMGDDVFGFVTIREGIKIHRMSCPNAARLIDNYPYRIQRVKWREGATGQSFQAALRISGYEESSTGQQIMEIINMLNISLRHFSISEQKGRLEAKLQVLVTNNQQLDKLIFNIRKLKGVKSVSRVSI